MKEPKAFSLRGTSIEDKLYTHLKRIIAEHGSFKDAVQFLLEKDKNHEFGMELEDIRSDLKREIMIEVREEIGLLKQYIGEQFDNRSFASISKRIERDTLEDVRQEQVYRPDDLRVTGRIDEDFNIDF